MPLLDWDERQAAIARLALTQLSYATDTGAERGEIARMLADLTGGIMPRFTIPRCAHCETGALAMFTRGPSPQYRYEHYDPR